MYIGLPENLTTIGSEIQFFCGNQTNQKFKGKPCVDNSLWREWDMHGHQILKVAILNVQRIEKAPMVSSTIILLHHAWFA